MSAEIRWTLARPTRFPGLVSGPGEDVDRNPARGLSAIALASVAAGAINIAAAATVGRGSAQNLAFFVVLGAAQLVWGAVEPYIGSVREPSPTPLSRSRLGCDQVPDRGSRHRRCRLLQPVERRAALAVAGVRVCSVLEEYLDGPQEACPGRVVQRCRPDSG